VSADRRCTKMQGGLVSPVVRVARSARNPRRWLLERDRRRAKRNRPRPFGRGRFGRQLDGSTSDPPQAGEIVSTERLPFLAALRLVSSDPPHERGKIVLTLSLPFERTQTCLVRPPRAGECRKPPFHGGVGRRRGRHPCVASRLKAASAASLTHARAGSPPRRRICC